MTKKPGTIVKEAGKVEKLFISGVAKDEDVARISIIGVPDRPGLAFKVFSRISAKNINVDIILQSVGRNGTKDISFTVARSNLKDALETIDSFLPSIGATKLVYDENVAKISIVGAGMETHPGTATKMFEALYEKDINIKMISTSEIKISVLIDIKDADKAVSAIHDKFFPAD